MPECEAPRQTLGGNQVLASPKVEINIVRAENGFILRIGCKVFVATTWGEASEGLALYFSNPQEAEKKYCKN